MDPTYLITYRYSAPTESGTGNLRAFRPRRGGRPSVLIPAHVDYLKGIIKEDLEESNVPDATVTILSVWRYEVM